MIRPPLFHILGTPWIRLHHDSAVHYAIPRVVLADLRGSSCEPRTAVSGQNDAQQPRLANLDRRRYVPVPPPAFVSSKSTYRMLMPTSIWSSRSGRLISHQRIVDPAASITEVPSGMRTFLYMARRRTRKTNKSYHLIDTPSILLGSQRALYLYFRLL